MTTKFPAAMISTLPPQLSSVLESGTAVLFVGAGLGSSALDSDGNAMPDGKALARELADKFSIDVPDDTELDLAKIAQVIEIRRKRSELIAFLSVRLAQFEPDESIKWLFSLTWSAIFTTNYDRLIQRCYELASNPTQTPVTISVNAGFAACDPRFQVPVYHLHGALFDVEKPHILITQQDYAEFRERRRMMFEILKHKAGSTTILYVGYGNQDSNWRQVMAEMREDFGTSQVPLAFRIAPSTDPLDREILAHEGIETIDATLEQFAVNVRASLGEIHVQPHEFDSSRSRVPTKLQTAFESNPAATLRLLNSWELVPRIPSGSRPNTESFLKGEKPNWELIAAGIPFERDIEDGVFDELLDFATTQSPKQPAILVLAPAGFGTSTVLRTLAHRLVKENAGVVFFHRLGTPILEGDVAFATSILAERVFFVIDNAADVINPLLTTCLHTKQTRCAVCFLLGERLNEWRQLPKVPRVSEHAITKLSDPEILRLLNCLETNRALGKLRDLDPELRVAAVREKHDRQLLVALCELIEGNTFPAIIEDEYRGVGTRFAKETYAAVAGMYKLRHPIRDQVLAGVLGRQLENLYKEIGNTLDGVVEFELIDESMGTYGARCRHHTIAEVVWERCVNSSDRGSFMLKVLQELNLNYYSDAKAYNALIRADDQIDRAGTFEQKLAFFELACQKDPRSSYVRQHFARMLLREKKHSLALAQIGEALEMAPHLRVLLHTKATILRDLALTVPSLELARKHLVQSEECYRSAILRAKRDAYGYQGLAELYLGWAEREIGEDEQADYMEKAEETVSEGLKNVRRRDSLWIVSSRVQECLGNNPKAQAQLEAAVRLHADNVLARYLLGRAYLQQDRPDLAVEILKPVLETDVNEWRACVLYVHATLRMGADRRSAIATLQLSELYGMRDPRYIATLGGLLFLDGQLTEAKNVFAQSERKGFPIEELQRIQFWPTDSATGNREAMEGTVVSVRAGFAFVSVPGFGELFCPGSKYDGILMVKGLKIRFEPAFTARGPLVTKPRRIDTTRISDSSHREFQPTGKSYVRE